MQHIIKQLICPQFVGTRYDGRTQNALTDLWYIFFFFFNFATGFNVQRSSQMGDAISNVCNFDNATNAHRAHRQTGEINGAIIIQC